MENHSKYIIRQNIFYPLGAILLTTFLIIGLFYLVDLYGGRIPGKLKILIVGTSIIILILSLLKRIWSWDLILNENTADIKRSFGLTNRLEKQIQFDEIDEVRFLQGFRMNTCLSIYLKSGKKYNVFLDKKLLDISKILNFLENSGLKVGLYCDTRTKEKLEKSR